MLSKHINNLNNQTWLFICPFNCVRFVYKGDDEQYFLQVKKLLCQRCEEIHIQQQMPQPKTDSKAERETSVNSTLCTMHDISQK